MNGFVTRPVIQGSSGVITSTHYVASVIGWEILQRDVHALDAAAAVHVGERAGDAEHAVIAARREFQALGGLGEQLAPGRVGCGHRLQKIAIGLGIAADRHGAVHRRVALALDGPHAGDARRHGGGILARRRQREVGGRDGRHVDVEIDTIEQGAGDLRLVLFGAFRGATTT